MRRWMVSLTAALALSVVVAGTALAAYCGNESKKDGAGQHATILVNLVTGTETIVSGGTRNGKLPGGYVDVWLDFNGDGTGDCFINDTFILSWHGGKVAPGQEENHLAVLPAVHHGANPGGAHGAGFAAAGC